MKKPKFIDKIREGEYNDYLGVAALIVLFLLAVFVVVFVISTIVGFATTAASCVVNSVCT